MTFPYKSKSIEISKGPKAKFSIYVDGEHMCDVSNRKYASTLAMAIVDGDQMLISHYCRKIAT